MQPKQPPSLQQQIKVAKDKSIQEMTRLYEQREIQSYLHATGQNLPKWDPATGLSKIPALWQGIFPETTHRATPYGKKEETWTGVALPEEVRRKLRVTRPTQPVSTREDLVLVLCNAGAQPKVSRPSLIKTLKWALASGFDPNEYNGRVTGVGLAAYSGQLDLLKVMHASGADLMLEIKPEHYSPGGGNPIGSTLLHRLTEREPRYPIYRELVLFLMDVYQNPAPVDIHGNTPLSLASGSFAPQIQAKLAQIEASHLQKLPQASKEAMDVKRL